ncbi:MAG: NUDIX hydrolase [Burkholderiaceae bacterium]|jgi:ADP-ribose pyrophosphatase|nr:NUDIX hydrolase [Burkholderiaceae bacterium]
MLPPAPAKQNLTETTLQSALLHKGAFFDVYRDAVELPNGKIAHREYIRHPGAVVILPQMPDGAFLLERQFRYPLGQAVIEFPAGKIDPGEPPLLCAQRELREETGYLAADWQFVCTIHNAAGYSNEHLHLFLASGLKAGKSEPDEGEFIETFSARVSDLLAWVREGKITDAKTIIGAFWLEKIGLGRWHATEPAS